MQVSSSMGMDSVPIRIEARILVVDDENLVQEFLREILERSGARVHVADSGSEAFRLLDAAHAHGDPYQIVITDLTLGEGPDGIGVARRARDRFAATRVVACTGHCEDRIFSAPADFGFDGCIAKPFLLQDIVELVEALSKRG